MPTPCLQTSVVFKQITCIAHLRAICTTQLGFNPSRIQLTPYPGKIVLPRWQSGAYLVQSLENSCPHPQESFIRYFSTLTLALFTPTYDFILLLQVRVLICCNWCLYSILRWEIEYQKGFACGFLHTLLWKLRNFGTKKLPLFTNLAEQDKRFIPILIWKWCIHVSHSTCLRH